MARGRAAVFTARFVASSATSSCSSIATRDAGMLVMSRGQTLIRSQPRTTCALVSISPDWVTKNAVPLRNIPSWLLSFPAARLACVRAPAAFMSPPRCPISKTSVRSAPQHAGQMPIVPIANSRHNSEERSRRYMDRFGKSLLAGKLPLTVCVATRP